MESKEKILLRKANEFYDKKNYQNSITTFEELLKIDKSNPDHFEKIGMCYFHSGNLILCLKNLNKAQKLQVRFCNVPKDINRNLQCSHQER